MTPPLEFHMVNIAVLAIMLIPGFLFIRGRIGPNPIFGYSTRRTRANREIWHRINRFHGYSVVIVAPIFLMARLASTRYGWPSLLPLALLVVPTACTFVYERLTR